jgi:hypothetical protein
VTSIFRIDEYVKWETSRKKLESRSICLPKVQACIGKQERTAKQLINLLALATS